MPRMSNAAFVENWFNEWRPEPPVYGRATRLLSKLLEHQPSEAWRRIQTLVAGASSSEDLEYIGSGPLEDLLCWHGAQALFWVEEKAAVNPRMVKCVGAVWAPNRMDAALHARLDRFRQSSVSSERPRRNPGHVV